MTLCVYNIHNYCYFIIKEVYSWIELNKCTNYVSIKLLSLKNEYTYMVEFNQSSEYWEWAIQDWLRSRYDAFDFIHH